MGVDSNGGNSRPGVGQLRAAGSSDPDTEKRNQINTILAE